MNIVKDLCAVVPVAVLTGAAVLGMAVAVGLASWDIL